MADCDWIVLCDYAFRAAHDKLGIIGIFDLIAAPDTPATHRRGAIAFSISGETGESGDVRLEIIGPSGQIIARATARFTLPESGSANGHIELQDLVLPEFGRYAIQIDLGETVPKQAWFTLAKSPAR